MSDNEKAATPPNAPATPATAAGAQPATAAAAPAAAAPKPAAAAKAAAPPKGAASPNAPRPSVVYSGIATLAVENIVVPFEHLVKPGETLESIAQDYFGDRSKGSRIRELNPDRLGSGGQPEPGTRIKIPKG